MPRLENAAELLDAPVHDPDVLARDFDSIEDVNRWLGGSRAVRLALADVLVRGATAAIVDVGCGSGDMPRAIDGFARASGAMLRVVGIDRHAQVIELARSRSAGRPALTFARADGLRLPFEDGAFEIAIMSLALHHFDGGMRAAMLVELARVASRRVIINELERCWPNYLGARLLAATVWRRNALARHDGPVSVLRGFTKAELRTELAAAGLDDVRVERRFFYRLVASGSPRRS